MGRPKGSTNKPRQEEMIGDNEKTQIEVASNLPAERHQTSLPATITPMSMLEKAVVSGADIEVIERLMDLQERWDAKQARRAFDEAMADAKAEIPTITKNRAVDFTSQKGRTNYRYEDLESVASAVGPALSKYGLSYRYRATSNIGEPVTVTCIISHRAGHFEELTLAAGRDDSGNKNSIQAVSSTMTYLQRISLKAALGLSVSNDDDGQGSEEKPKDSGPPRQLSRSVAPEPGPGQDHAAGDVQDGEPPRRAPKPAERKADPITSGPQRATPKAAAQTVTPYKIPGDGHTYETWAAQYVDSIKTSPDMGTLYKWIDVNADPLARLNAGKPSVYGGPFTSGGHSYEGVKKETEQLQQAFKDAQEKAQQKTAKSAAKAKPAEPPPSDMGDAPASDMDETTTAPDYGKPADDNPETVLKFIDGVLATAEDPADIEVLWERECQRYTVDMIPPDRDEAAALVRKHEKRLEP